MKPSTKNIVDDLLRENPDARGAYDAILRMAFRGRIITYMAGAEAEIEILGQFAGGDGNDRSEIEWMAESRHAELPDDLWR